MRKTIPLTFVLLLIIAMTISLFFICLSVGNNLHILPDLQYPIFKLNEKGVEYQITKVNSSYWLQRIESDVLKQNDSMPYTHFKGDAIRVSSVNFNLDDYLDVNVIIRGKFQIRDGQHTYFIIDIKKKE